MKRTLYPVLAAVLLAACGPSEKEIDQPVEKKDSTSHVVAKPGNGADNDVVDGEYTKKYPDGTLKIKGTMASGMRKGEWISYYPNGTKQSECQYEDGKMNGKIATYYPSGKLRYIGYHQWDQPIGVWEFYNEDGTINQTKDYGKH